MNYEFGSTPAVVGVITNNQNGLSLVRARIGSSGFAIRKDRAADLQSAIASGFRLTVAEADYKSAAHKFRNANPKQQTSPIS